MNKQARFIFPVAAFLVITFLSVGTAGAQTNTAVGIGALMTPHPALWTTVRSDTTP